MGMNVRVKGIKRYRHPGTGKVYCYHRKTNTRILSDFGSADFFVELAALEKSVQTRPILPGTLGLVLSAYMTSPGWLSLRAKTRLSYQRVFVILKPLRDMPLLKIDRAFVFKLRDMRIFPKHGTWMANYTVTVLAILLRFARDRGWIKIDPLEGRIKRLRSPNGDVARNSPWTENECATVLEHAPIQLKLPIALAMCAGLRKTDFLNATMSALKDGSIAIRTSKRGVQIKIPIHPLLAEALAERPKSSSVQIAVNSRGEPWTESGFNASFRTFKKRLEAEELVDPGLTPHGLRHTLGTRLREAGADDRTIADVLGQKATSMARLYSENATFPVQARELVLGLDLSGRKNKC